MSWKSTSTAMIPEALKVHIQQELGEAVVSARSVSGGSINRAARVELSSGRSCFLKWNASENPDMFDKEVKGLELLRGAGTGLVIPAVLLQGTVNDKTGFLLQEFIEEGPPAPDSARAFGRELARLHQVQAAQYGLDHDNYIGYLPQRNRRHRNWTAFFIQQRIEPQLSMALDKGRLSNSITPAFESLYRQLPDIFPQAPPGLLHGDLWSGNYFYGTNGQAAIFDPAVYFGHREMELAFTRLFGGFSSGFYRAYQEAWPLEPGFEQRVDIYNLYPLLVHTNIFGGSYARQVEAILRRFA